jgi:hypothetical protein
LRNGDGAGEIAKDMDMIFYSVDDDRIATHVLQGSGQVGMRAGAKFRVLKELDTVLCAKRDVENDPSKGLGYSEEMVVAPLRGLAS